MIVHNVTLRWSEVTGGSAGLRIPPPELFGMRLDRTGVYYLVLALAFVAFLVQAFVKGTHLGRALEAIKTDETAAASLGIDVSRYKTNVFVLAAVFAAVAGISFTIVGRVVDPSFSGVGMAVSLLTLAVVGGLGSHVGSFLGATIIILVPQLLASVSEYETLVYGIGLLMFIIFAPRGLAGLFEHLSRTGAAR
jgi:branched-chain amino acid transport system permease protein